MLELRTGSELMDATSDITHLNHTPNKEVPLPQEVIRLKRSKSKTEQTWQKMTSQVKRTILLTKTHQQQNKNAEQHPIVLRISTTRMRCSHKVKDELEQTAGTVYVKTVTYVDNVRVASWKSSTFYPSLSTKWGNVMDGGADANPSTLLVPLKSLQSLEDVLIKVTLATKTKMGKKLVLATVMIDGSATPLREGGNSSEHLHLLRNNPANSRIPMWHSYK